jgi:peptidoglycan/LPS O-acetylase OafA/YrhL
MSEEYLNSYRLKAVDFLRGCASLAVVLHHAINYGNNIPSESSWFTAIYVILNQGHLGVPMFFVISSFCIHLKWAKQRAGNGAQTFQFIDFWKRRVHRLYPPYFVALCFSMALIVLAFILGKAVPLVSLYPAPRPKWMAMDFVAHLLMLHGLHPIFDKAGGNPPFWTLAREEYFYLMYFVLLLSRRKIGLISSVVGVFVLGIIFPFIMSFFLSEESTWWGVVTTSAIVLWIQWCLGMIAVEAYVGLLKLPNFLSSGYWIPIWGTFAYLSETSFSRLSPVLWGMTFFTTLNFFVKIEKMGKWKSDFIILSWLTRVGVFSYSLYLVHNPARAIVKQLLGPLSNTNSPFVYLVMATIMAVAGYFRGKLFYFLIERHFLKYHSLKTPRAIAVSQV